MTETKTATVGDLELAYETFGEATDPALLLVMGLGTQMLAWPDELCVALAAAGRYVIRFDNRDVGLSTHLAGLPTPAPLRVLLRRSRPPYRVEDMADDALGLLDALGIVTADVVGASMGGFIAQEMALRARGRVRTLTLIMTSTGSRLVGYPRPTVAKTLLDGRPTRGRAEAIERTMAIFALIGSRGYDRDQDELRAKVALAYDRAHDPAGQLRQTAAVMAQRDRTRALRRLDLPTLVIHGLDDPLVSATGGLALARAIKGSRFLGFPGMGHDLPRSLWGQMGQEIARLATSVDAAG